MKSEMSSFNSNTMMTVEANEFHLPPDRQLYYEKTKIVGKGAFGTATLYERKHDGLSVVIKQVNMLDLSAAERQMALNEAKVLSTLNHTNIITYYDSFEHDCILSIEMEYADGGTLQEYLSKLETPKEEREILDYFSQIVSAIQHMHERHVLHRDLKTANIFLTKEGQIKVGDFGISKMNSTTLAARGANTVVGTPYYISPEMCEGKQYNEKSDIWALGCILYEMMCLHKTFEASNLPALVQKIVKGQFAPIRGNYSALIRQLVRDMLQPEPQLRPTAREIIKNKIPQLIKQCDKESMKIKPATSTKQTRSVLYHVEFTEEDSLDLFPFEIPPRQSVQQVATSSTHTLVLTNGMQVYGWGDNTKGQLGVDTSSDVTVTKPLCIQALNGKIVTMIGAGDGFSIFACNNGIIMSCGDGTKGCLGHGDWNSISKPKIIEKLLSVDVTAVSCGPSHVVVVGEEKWAFSWGSGLHGRLGHDKEENVCTPMEIVFAENLNIRAVRCGQDGTLFLTTSGRGWACGNNVHNKLALDTTTNFWSWSGGKEVNQKMVPTKIETISRPIIDASLGPTHSAFLLNNGQVITCGHNSDGQLGREQHETDRTIKIVSALKNNPCNMVLCGPTYTVAGSMENSLYFWGRKTTTMHGNNIRDDSIKMNRKEVRFLEDIDKEKYEHCLKSKESSEKINIRNDATLPQEILVLFASSTQIKNGEMVTLSGLFQSGSHLYLMVNTTAPVPHRSDCPFLNYETVKVDRNQQSDCDIEDSQPVPEWIQKEFQNSEVYWQTQKPQKNRKKKNVN